MVGCELARLAAVSPSPRPLKPLLPSLTVVLLGSLLISLLLAALAGWGVALACFLTLLAGGLVVLSINRQ